MAATEVVFKTAKILFGGSIEHTSSVCFRALEPIPVAHLDVLKSGVERFQQRFAK